MPPRLPAARVEFMRQVSFGPGLLLWEVISGKPYQRTLAKETAVFDVTYDDMFVYVGGLVVSRHCNVASLQPR